MINPINNIFNYFYDYIYFLKINKYYIKLYRFICRFNIQIWIGQLSIYIHIYFLQTDMDMNINRILKFLSISGLIRIQIKFERIISMPLSLLIAISFAICFYKTRGKTPPFPLRTSCSRRFSLGVLDNSFLICFLSREIAAEWIGQSLMFMAFVVCLFFNLRQEF